MKKRDNRRQGQWVEALFVARATAEGLNVSKPWGTYRYDFLVERDGHAWRVQVKSCRCRCRHHYICLYQSSRCRPYRADEFDFVVIYVIPEDVWYVLPMKLAVRCRSSIVLSPHLPDSKYAGCKEAWHLLRGERPAAAGRRSRPAMSVAPSERT